MKKILLSLVAFLMMVGIANAQVASEKFETKKAAAGLLEKRNGGLKDFSKKNMTKAPQKIALPDNQKLMGPYDTDEVATSNEGLGLPSYPGDLKIAAYVDASGLKRFEGGKVVKMRYGLAYACTVKDVFIYGVDNTGRISLLVSEDVTEKSLAGWNIVEMSQPLTLDFTGYVALLMGYTYVQGSTNTNSSYPLSLASDVSSTTYVYGNLGNGASWYDIGADRYGSLSVQAFVEKDYPDDDLALTSLMASAFGKLGDKVYYDLVVNNYGKTAPESYAINVAVDGNVVATLSSPVDFSKGSTGVYSGELTVPADLVSGKHALTATVADINGVAPTEYTSDDVISTQFTVYTASFAHQKQLVEHFTSIGCTYCPGGDDILMALTDKRDDIARVSVHGNMNVADPFVVNEGNAIMQNLYVGGFPSAAFNRITFDFGTGDGLTIAQVLGYQAQYKDLVASMFSEALDQLNAEYPAFATINISAASDEAGKLSVKVSGEGVSDFADVMGNDAVLNVCVIEDGLSYMQLNSGTWVPGYTHNCVLRGYLSNVVGDAINWNGSAYENDYVLTLPEAWNAENMRVVAYISCPLDSESALNKFVSNTEMVEVMTPAKTGIAMPVADDAAVETARYTADGVLLTTPRKGLNIVKMSNGEMRKVVVK